jgi:hypothetical protein
MEEREDPPELEMAMPNCSVCGRTVELEDDKFVCKPCGARWKTAYAFTDPGTWQNPSVSQCPSVSRFGDRCLLAENHEPAVHRRGWDDWRGSDGQPR